MNYFIIYTGYVLILSVLMGISTWKLFKKMGYHPLFAFIPFYNYYIIQKETNHPKWWVAMAYLPIVGPIMMSVFHLFLMKKFRKDSFVQKLLTVMLPFLYMAFVNYSKDTELEGNAFQLTGEVDSKKKESFLGSITFAVVFATIIHVFITQPFGIPTGSMERTLLVGDFLFVNKLNYGFRMPMRPVAIPFLQGTIMDTGEKGNPKDDPKSYVEAVKLPYLRLPGWEKPVRNDIVVFNYPDDSVHVAIDRKDPYVKRLVAQPGDVMEFRAGKLFINGKPEQRMGDAQVQHSYELVTSSQLDIPALYNIYGFLPVSEYQTNAGFTYIFQGLTDETAKDLGELPQTVSLTEVIGKKGEKDISYYPDIPRSIAAQQRVNSTKINTSSTIFPINKPWNTDWYGPLRIPKKGDVLQLTQENLPEYRKLIVQYEGNTLENKDGKISINGQATSEYTVKYDYYMMVGDNRDASLDGRFFGYVPETHIVGKPMFTWMSVEGLFANSDSTYQADGLKFRWDRMFKATNTGDPDKPSYWWLAVLVLVLFFGWDFFTGLFRKKNEE
ncbi:signal peptidase I [Chryseobacterium lacus]|uniref:signal peptidase I n=1 Tax=Chryseobacterium lacus TaxID=2058346 RepID=UPI000F8702AF|nr:signal peptidase I [Chryseobacterium lacus]RST26050.1 signal peptidase I [Chryseobacterium lacus]